MKLIRDLGKEKSNRICRRVLVLLVLVISMMGTLGVTLYLVAEFNKLQAQTVDEQSVDDDKANSQDQDSGENDLAESEDDLEEGSDPSGEDTSGDSEAEDDSDSDEVIPTPPDERISVPGEKLFHIETSIGTQSVFNGNVPIYIYVKPYIDSSKAQIQWDVPRGLKIESKSEQWFEMTKDEPMTFKLLVSPQESGDYEIIADVTAWRYDTNYVDAAEINLSIGEDLLVEPKSPEYKRNMIFLTVGKIALAAAGVAGVYFLYKIGKEKFKVWMSQD